MTISEIQKEVHRLAIEKGWYESDRKVPELLCLVHSEISEALEKYRDGTMGSRLGADGKPEGFAIELADAVIRILDMCEHLHIDLESAIVAKHAFNRTRPHRHGGKLA